MRRQKIKNYNQLCLIPILDTSYILWMHKVIKRNNPIQLALIKRKD